MDRGERNELRQLVVAAQTLADQAQTSWEARQRELDAGARAEAKLKARVRQLTVGSLNIRLLPMSSADGYLITDLLTRTEVPNVNQGFLDWLADFPRSLAAARADLAAEISWTGVFAGKAAKQRAQPAAAWLRELMSNAESTGLRARVLVSAPPNRRGPAALDLLLTEPLANMLGLAQGPGAHLMLMSATPFRDLPRVASTIARASAFDQSHRAGAQEAATAVRHAEAKRILDEMPLERVQDVTAGRVRLGALRQVGWTTVGQLLAHEHELMRVDGVGEVTATRLRGAARTIQHTTFSEMPVRIDIKRRSPETTVLLQRLHAWDAFRQSMRQLADTVRRAEELRPVARAIESGATDFVVASASPGAIIQLRDAVQRLIASAQALAPGSPPAGDPWADFLERPAEYFTMLAELGFAQEDEEKAHGELPREIVEAVRGLELKTEHLNVSLRGYQSFAARFALVQKKVIIGDEMGLGKTIEALAVLAHLRSSGQTHFLVICPAAVVTNWMREVASKTTLPAHRLHGYEREAGALNWRRRGGVAVTTYESLGWYSEARHGVTLDCVVADEAHAIKNPSAKRSLRSSRLLAATSHAVLMTGTPLENRVDEFHQLVDYIRPDLVLDRNDLSPRRFRQQVAPAYLRRNQDDVLSELPERVEVEEWLPLSTVDEGLYRAAVAQGNFMAMRQAAMLGGKQSQKIERLLEIIDEAQENGRKVIVFSYFRDVLSHVAALVQRNAHGPLTGLVPAGARQDMVDKFTRAPGGAVLIAQIQAGGVGLNIQSASVVVICEPQFKPTLEDQAIARAHRMGQVQSVQVHRLLSDVGVDTRIVDLLAEKRRIFDEFARRSETAASAPEAFDLSEAELARQIVAEERQRLAGG